MIHIHRSLLAACFSVGLAFVSLSASAADSQKPAVDERDQILHNTWGNCVRTKWQSANDACAPAAPEPAPAPVAAPAPAPEPVATLDQRTVYFDFDSAALTAESVGKLDALVEIIKNSKQIIQAGVIGYADEMGNEAYNLALSEQRSEAVRNYLDSRVSIDTKVLEVRSLGEGNPVTNCAGIKTRAEKIACLAQDRRVEVAFKYNK
jgi:OOP family OmpA-OmpF porin